MAKRWQYPSYVEPVLDEAQRPETVLLDKYWQPPSEPLHTAPRSAAALYASSVLVEFGIPIPVPDIGFLIVAVDPARKPPAPIPPLPELVPGAGALPEFITLDRWFQQASEPQRQPPLPWLEAATELVLDETQRPEIISLDKWWREADNPLWPVPFPQPTFPLLPPFIEEIALDKWWRQPSEPQRQPPIPWLEPATELVLEELQRPEAVSLDKWWTPDSVPLRLRPFAGAGLTIRPPFVEEIITLDKWWREADNPLPAPPSPYYYPWIDYQVLRPEIVTLDKWWRESDNPLPAPPSPYFYPWTEYQILRPEIVTLDKWWREADNPLPAPPSPYYYPWISYHTLGPEIVTLDKWFQPASGPLFLPLRVQGWFFLPLLAVVAPPFVIIPFVFDDCLWLWEIIHPSSWESAVAPSGYKEPIIVIIPSNYVKKAGGTTLWDL